MKIVLQRVSKASVSVEEKEIGAIRHGLLLLLGIHQNDTEQQMQWLCNKVLKLRVFDDKDGKMNKSILDVEGELLVVPQFTLYGDTASSGNRPSYTDAARPKKASKLYNKAVSYFKKHSPLKVETGKFGAYMNVQLNNDGPVTLLLER